MTTLVSLGKRPLVIVLPHDSVCAKIGRCTCSRHEIQTMVRDANGDKQIKNMMRLVPGAIHLSAKESVEVHEAVVALPQVQAAIRNRLVRTR